MLAIPAPANAQASAATTVPALDSGGVLQPGDLVRLRIWREPDLSGDFPVDQTGTAVLPKLGPTTVTGRQPDVLKAKLIAAYQEYLSHPSIEITFLRRVQVYGAVRTPGLYPVDMTMRLGDVLALAGGVTPDGNLKKMVLIRNGAKLSPTLSYGARVMDSQIRSGDEIFVPERGWISRNPGILATLITASVSLFIAFHR